MRVAASGNEALAYQPGASPWDPSRLEGHNLQATKVRARRSRP